jgi:hypothetical protein
MVQKAGISALVNNLTSWLVDILQQGKAIWQKP